MISEQVIERGGLNLSEEEREGRKVEEESGSKRKGGGKLMDTLAIGGGCS